MKPKGTMKAQLRAILDEQPRYQTHTWRGEILNTGIRGIERRGYFQFDDFKGKSILDLGCATGAETLWAAEMGAMYAVGVDSSTEAIETLKRLVQVCKLGQVLGIQHDLREGLPAFVLERQWDTVLFCSIAHHLAYRPLWQEVPGARVIYLESGADWRWQDHYFSDEWKVEQLALLPGSCAGPTLNRQFIRLSR